MRLGCFSWSRCAVAKSLRYGCLDFGEKMIDILFNYQDFFGIRGHDCHYSFDKFCPSNSRVKRDITQHLIIMTETWRAYGIPDAIMY